MLIIIIINNNNNNNTTATTTSTATSESGSLLFLFPSRPQLQRRFAKFCVVVVLFVCLFVCFSKKNKSGLNEERNRIRLRRNG